MRAKDRFYFYSWCMPKLFKLLMDPEMVKYLKNKKKRIRKQRKYLVGLFSG